jgi:hypothetical protein
MLTKFAHFFAISSKYIAAQVAEIFFRQVFWLHGLPKTIVSDRDNRFMGGFWQELLRTNDPKPLCKDHHGFGVFLKLFLGCGISSNNLLIYLSRCVYMCVCNR